MKEKRKQTEELATVRRQWDEMQAQLVSREQEHAKYLQETKNQLNEQTEAALKEKELLIVQLKHSLEQQKEQLQQERSVFMRDMQEEFQRQFQSQLAQALQQAEKAKVWL